MLTVLSLGAGVQSTTLALMAARGELPAPDCAIFADTRNEAQATYRHLDWLETQLPFPVHRVSAGDLGADFMAAITGATTRCAQPPFYVRNPVNDGTIAADSGGMLWRQCTKEYKLQPIRAKTRELSAGQPVEQWIGISLDECHRMRDSNVGYITNRYPLIERRMTRGDCLAWLARNGYPQPPKSACYFCPYTSDERWRAMKASDEPEWTLAVAFDDALRSKRIAKLAAGIKGEIFVHRSMTPLRDADLADMGTADLFGADCDGMCGT